MWGPLYALDFFDLRMELGAEKQVGLARSPSLTLISGYDQKAIIPPAPAAAAPRATAVSV